MDQKITIIGYKIYSIEEKVRRLHFKRAFQWHKSLFTNLSQSCLSDLQIDTNSHLDSIAVQCLHIFLTIQVILVLWDNLKSGKNTWKKKIKKLKCLLISIWFEKFEDCLITPLSYRLIQDIVRSFFLFSFHFYSQYKLSKYVIFLINSWKNECFWHAITCNKPRKNIHDW